MKYLFFGASLILAPVMVLAAVASIPYVLMTGRKQPAPEPTHDPLPQDLSAMNEADYNRTIDAIDAVS